MHIFVFTSVLLNIMSSYQYIQFQSKSKEVLQGFPHSMFVNPFASTGKSVSKHFKCLLSLQWKYCCFLMSMLHTCIGLCSPRAMKTQSFHFFYSTNTYLSSKHYVSHNVVAVGIQQWTKHCVGKGIEREKNRYKPRKWQSWDLNPDRLTPEFILYHLPLIAFVSCSLPSTKVYNSLESNKNASVSF